MTDKPWSEVVDAAQRIGADLAEYASRASEVEEPERLGPSEETLTRVGDDPLPPADPLIQDFDARITDPDLRRAARSRFISNHYADAVEAGVKCLNECVRSRSGRLEDGDGLMTSVFSPSNPILRINPLRSKSDVSAQRGHMHLCQGVIGAWRNPRAHSLLDDEPDKALMMLENINELIAVTKAATRTRQRRPTKK